MARKALWVITTLMVVGSHLCNAYPYHEYEQGFDQDHEEKKASLWEYFKSFFNVFKKHDKDKKHKNFHIPGTYPVQLPPLDIPLRPFLPPQEIIHHHHHYHHHTSPQLHEEGPVWTAH